MRKEDNDCIRYLMKEMDPSEELLMERAMMEDEDLLIEVESMRQTLKKLDKLPEVEPPSDVTKAVLEKAAKQAQKNKKENTPFIKPAYKYAVAATLALTITAGGAWLFMGENSQTQPASVASSTEANLQPSATEAQYPANHYQTVSSDAQSKQKVKPWIDRNDILRFEDQFSTQNNKFEAILQQSTQKLRRIENPSVSGGRVNPIQLTGSGN